MAAMAALQSSMIVILIESSIYLKSWERKKCKPNSLPILHKIHVKVGDTVKVISGRGGKGKVGEITKIFKHNSTVVVND